ncbi:MAG: hypothetical protein AB7S26_22090 [Sandaracinaceae bacterium]
MQDESHPTPRGDVRPSRSTPEPSVGDKLRLSYHSLKDSFEQLKDRAELKAHLGMMELETRFSTLEPRIMRLSQRAEDVAGQTADDLRGELRSIRDKIDELKAKVTS